eukprot:6463675-Amphidinium_carterae.1
MSICAVTIGDVWLAWIRLQPVVCCRHSRYTPSWGWNPLGGFPMLDGLRSEARALARHGKSASNLGNNICPLVRATERGATKSTAGR